MDNERQVPAAVGVEIEISPRLLELETVIERGKLTFVEVGNALAEIRDSRLYRAQYSTFEQYCKERWGWSRSYSYRQIEAAQAVQVLPMGNIPTNERGARPLVTLTPEEREKVAGSIGTA